MCLLPIKCRTVVSTVKEYDKQEMGEPEEKSSSDNLSVKESPVHKLDIPDHLIEIPAPEQLSKLDRTMDSVKESRLV